MSAEHTARHPTWQPGCLACKVRSLSLGSGALPNRRHEARGTSARDAAWDADMAAYKRLRDDGLQPPTIDGSAALERDATTADEVADGRVRTTAERAAHAAAVEHLGEATA